MIPGMFRDRYQDLDPETRARLLAARRRQLSAFQRVDAGLRRSLQVVLGVVFVAVVVGGGLLLVNLDDGSRSQGGVVYLGIFVIVAAVALWRVMQGARRSPITSEMLEESLEERLGPDVDVRLDAKARLTVAPPSSEELDRIRQLLDRGLSLDDACRLARPGYSWLDERERRAYRDATGL